jgi:hypothetical protein
MAVEYIEFCFKVTHDPRYHWAMYLRLFVAVSMLVSSAFAQTDWAGFAAGLRSKYGPPLLRETFVPKPGVEMAVDYAANGNVCKIQLPSYVLDDFLTELIPVSMRGKELRKMVEMSGMNSIRIVEYENVAVSESYHGDQRTGVTVSFPKEQCRDKVQ